AVYLDRQNPDHVEIHIRAKLFQKIEIAASLFSERPFMAHADFAEWFGMSDQLLHKIFRLGRGELFVEINDEQVLHAESADQGDLMLGCAQQVGRGFRSQNLFRMWVERDHNRRSTRSAGMSRRC